MGIANVAAGLALVAALGYAWWSSGNDRRKPSLPVSEPPTVAVGSATSATAAPPFEPYAHAQVGDWRAYDYSTRSSLGNFSSHVIARVTGAPPGAVMRTGSES